MATSLDELKKLSGIPSLEKERPAQKLKGVAIDLDDMRESRNLSEAKLPPRTKKSIHTSSKGTDFTLCPVKLTTTYPKDAPSSGGKTTWKEVKKSSKMDNDWLVKSRSDQNIGILSYDDNGKEWNLNKLRGKEVRAMVAASGKDLAKVLDHA